MAKNLKKQVRQQFQEQVFRRDKYACRVCGRQGTATNAPLLFDAHHITDRNKMPHGGYVAANGITVCKESCHLLVEEYHLSDGKSWGEGLHPDDLYKLIGSNFETALQAATSAGKKSA